MSKMSRAPLDLKIRRLTVKASPSKRTVTPKSEASSSHKRTTILETGSPKPSHQIIKIDTQSAMNATAPVLGLNLHDFPDDFFTPHAMDALRIVFPEILEFSFDHFMLIIRVAKLPEDPWPYTVADVPCFITTMKSDQGPLGGLQSTPVRTKLDILSHIDARGKKIGSNTDLFHQHVDQVIEYFRLKKVDVTQLQNWNDFVVLVLKDKQQMTEHIPRSIMRMPCYILLEDNVKRRREPALRLKITNPPDYDDGKYEILRPGVMVTCEKFDDNLSLTTTSGVLIEDNSGIKYLTVASHGFPNRGEVLHPRSNGRSIGDVVEDFAPAFDVALVKLRTDEKFENETFKSIEGNDGCKLTGLASISSLRKGDFVYMNNPFMGECHGSIGAITYDPWKLLSNDSAQAWVTTGQWIWTGQKSSQSMPDSICGTLITNDEDEVVGFFRYVGSGLFENFCYSTGAENLRVKGYKICKEYE